MYHCLSALPHNSLPGLVCTFGVSLICTIILREQEPAGKMGRFNAVLFLFFSFGLMISASMAKAPSHAQAPIAAVPKAAPIESPAASPPASTPSEVTVTPVPKAAPIESRAAAPPASAPSEVAKTPSSASSATSQTPARSPTAEGPGTALPPSNAAVATVSIEKIMAIFGPALLGAAAFFV